MKRTPIKIKALPAVMPKCWDRPDDWAAWQQLNQIAGPVTRSKALGHYCADCTPEYAARMIAAGRCAYPDPATRPTKVHPNGKA